MQEKKTDISSEKFTDKCLLPMHGWLSETRRWFHQHPEVKYQERKTSEKILEILREMNVPHTGNIGGTGIVAKLTAKKPGAVIAYRADMDALPLHELNEVPYKSLHEGCMHACGHDSHITIALGIIKNLIETGWQNHGKGELVFIFQPAEEGGAGAEAMLKSGFFNNIPVKAAFAAHVLPDLPVGVVSILPSIAAASTDTIIFQIKGKGGHGAHPENCHDPIIAGAYLVTQLQTMVSREISPVKNAVVTIGKFHSGSAINIIPEDAMLEGTLRTLDPDVRKKLLKRMAEQAEGISASFDVNVDFKCVDGYPMLKNDPVLNAYMKSMVKSVLGEKSVFMGPQSLGGEDFSFFCDEWGGVMVDLGCRDPETEFCYGLHSPYFDIDERVLDVGVHLFSSVLTNYLEKEDSNDQKAERI